MDIQGDGGVNIHHKDPNAPWPSYQIDIGEDGNLVIRVEDKDGDLIQIINQKPGQPIELPLYGGNGDSVVIDGDGTVHMPGPGGDAIAKPDGEGGWDFGQTPPDGGITSSSMAMASTMATTSFPCLIGSQTLM